MKIYYEDILVGEILTNRSLHIDEALDLIGFNKQEFIAKKWFIMRGVKQMTEYKKYYVGEKHYQWEVEVIIYQKRNLYKFVLIDDEDDIYITSNYVTSTVAAALERTIDEIMYEHESAQYESLTDIYNRLKDTSYGRILFSIGKGKKSYRN